MEFPQWPETDETVGKDRKDDAKREIKGNSAIRDELSLGEQRREEDMF